jgi:predicted unusual protein kinase regulating ubiquinone biosynthesis (AarF/ABC1/UbiB family)
MTWYFMDEQEKLTTSAFGRFLKLGALAGKVGFSLVGEKALGLFLSEDSREMRMAKSWAKNAEKIAETLGKLKGGAMKIGQMLSIQEALLPKELTFVLKSLQRDAPTVSARVMYETLDGDIPDWRQRITEIDDKPLAAASIGQVHRARLNDGREVAIKIQYPKIDQAIFSDLKNLRRLFELILESMLAANLDHLFAEIEARLVEEVDYRRELRRIDEFRAFYADRPEILIPKPVPELSSQRVLTTELLMGYTIEEARKHGEDERNTWGRLLFRSLAEQLLAFRQIQSDPNPANYAFRDGGKLILYDFGSIKELPDWLHQGYIDTVDACREGRFEDLTQVLVSLQVKLKNGEPVPYKHVELFREALSPVFAERPYRFSTERDPIKKIINYNRENFNELKDITFPGDVIFVDRAIIGLVGNLTALGAEANWADELSAALKK